MMLQVTSDNIELSESMKKLAEAKLEKLNRHWQNIPDDNITVRVVLNEGSADDTFEVKLDVDLNGTIFHAEEANFELETTLIGAIEDLERQYLKFKEKRLEKGWEEQRDSKTLSEEDLQEMIDA